MSELKADKTFVFGEECEAYKKSEADKVIAELQKQVNAHNNRANLWHYNAQNEHNATVAVRMENAKLKATERRLKRALWLARANRALDKIAWFKLWNASISTMNPEDGARQEFDKWKKNLGKFLKKAEEYR